MHAFGGVYADLDVTPCDAFAEVMSSTANRTPHAQLLLVQEPRGPLSNFFLGSAAGADLLPALERRFDRLVSAVYV